MSEAEPLSPCISICTLDDQDICQGCFRSGVEITDWLMAGATRKREILQRALERQRESTPIKGR